MRTWMGAIAATVALVTSSAAEAACTGSPVSAETLRSTIDDALQEYPRFDEGSFLPRAEGIIASIPCLTDVAKPDLVARIHRLTALKVRISDGNDKRARLAFASARSVDPTFELPSWLAGPLDPERAEYNAIPLDLISRIDLRQPTEDAGTVYIDGKATLERPKNVPTLFQRKVVDHVVETTYLWPADPDPVYDMVPIYEDRPPTSASLLVSGSAAAIAGAGATLISLAGWDIVNICPQDRDDVCRLQARDRIIGGSLMVVGGTGGFLFGQYFLDGSGAVVGVKTRW
jgi:hypothetical protein